MEKVSPKRNKTISQNVEIYIKRHPEARRSTLRTLIRLDLNITNPSELRKLDRCLKKAFENQAKRSTKEKPSNSILRRLLNKSNVSKRLIRKQLEKYPEIKSLLEDYERKFGKIEDIMEEILDGGSDHLLQGFVKESIKREDLRRLIAERIEDLIYPV